MVHVVRFFSPRFFGCDLVAGSPDMILLYPCDVASRVPCGEIYTSVFSVLLFLETMIVGVVFLHKYIHSPSNIYSLSIDCVIILAHHMQSGFYSRLPKCCQNVVEETLSPYKVLCFENLTNWGARALQCKLVNFRIEPFQDR